MTQEIIIQARRAATCWDSSGNPKSGIGDYILEYGELLYLEDLDIIIVGNGRQYNYKELAEAASTTPTSVHYAEDTEKWIGGSTVAELVTAHEYFAKVLSPTLYGKAEYQYINDAGEEIDIPEDANDNTIANIKFSKDYTDKEIKILRDAIGNQTIDSAASKTLTKFVTDNNGKVTLTFSDIAIAYSQISSGDKPTASTDSTNYPLMDGTRAAGTHQWIYAREDHVHPTDTSRAPLNSPELTGTPKSTTPTAGDNSTRIATTAFVTTALNNKSIVESKTQNKSDTIYVTGVKTSGNTQLYFCGTNSSASTPAANTDGVRINCSTGALFGAAWNDFAEFRKCNAEPGTVVCETGKGDLEISSKKLQPGAAIVSDTYGIVIGPEEPNYRPVAVAGRVLAKYLGSTANYQPGMPVCAGPGGIICPMTRYEIKEFPESIVGYVSEIPDYDEWNNIKINNRIWIKVK